MCRILDKKLDCLESLATPKHTQGGRRQVPALFSRGIRAPSWEILDNIAAAGFTNQHHHLPNPSSNNPRPYTNQPEPRANQVTEHTQGRGGGASEERRTFRWPVGSGGGAALLPSTTAAKWEDDETESVAAVESGSE
uniref:Uncharacterized protein n=1 Tax=Oryza nivara TaxID=4536 RepID=A0A0E0HM47_ORYNI